MKNTYFGAVVTILLAAGQALGADRVKTAQGELEGTGPQASGVREFKGIPFGEPPTGDLRWKAPQAVKSWTGTRQATQFGPRCMQLPLFGDMGFRSNGMSEDCLYLNVWTPAKNANTKLPVMVYFFGGGFQAGDGSEPRYDGESMAAKGIVSITVNYRLGIFGFLAHPELTKESEHHASGNYGLLDQSAALRWVKQNVAAFGGDPNRVTIAGESAGSFSVSAQMISPLSRDLIAGAIGESGSVLALAPAPTLSQAEETGAKFGTTAGAGTLAALRALTPQQLLDLVARPGSGRFNQIVDGYFFPEAPIATVKAGKQAHVPLLAGWNSEEQGARSVLQREEPTQENFEKAIRRLFPETADAVIREYAPVHGDVVQAATDLGSDRFIAYSTWKWLDAAGKTGGKPVYRYYYSRPRPKMSATMGNAVAGLAGGVVRGGAVAPGGPPPPPRGAVHSAEIEYALGNLPGNTVYDWTPEDQKVSSVMEDYFANFVKTGNPNGGKLVKWPAANKGTAVQYLRIDVETRVETEAHRGRYLLLDKIANQVF
jgi:para-nitrobenzyl esterase